MKKLITSALALSFISPVFASDVIRYEVTSQTCWKTVYKDCLLYTSPSPRDATLSRMPSSA